MKKFFLWIALIATCANAAPYYSMETNQIVNEGDSMEKVQAACGAPTQVNIKDEMASVPVDIIEWVYMVRPTNPSQTEQYLARLIIVFNNQGKVTQLKQSQMTETNQQATITCGVGSVKVGDEASAVQANCGAPSFINKFQSSETVTKKIVEWRYQKNSYLVPVVFRFENGIVKQINNG